MCPQQTSNFSEHEGRPGKVNVNVGRQGIKPAVHIEKKSHARAGTKRGRQMRMEIHDYRRAVSDSTNFFTQNIDQVDNIWRLFHVRWD